MDILEPGKVRASKPWNGKILTCRACKCKFQINAGDKVTFSSDQRDSHHELQVSDNFYEVDCPNPECDTKIKFSA
jgi:hypothetical protein